MDDRFEFACGGQLLCLSGKRILIFHSHRGFSPVTKITAESRNRFNGFSEGCLTSRDVQLLALMNFNVKVYLLSKFIRSEANR